MMVRLSLSLPVSGDFSDLVPFLCAGSLVLIFTTLFALLIEDEASSSHGSPVTKGGLSA